MSLGGYKFAGYKCNYTSGMSDGDLALLIHKTRLKAFVEACAKSGSNWHFYRNDGQEDFEGYTGVIHYVLGSPPDRMSFLQYGNENKYIVILTFPGMYDDIFFDKSRGKGKYSSNNNDYIWRNRTLFHCASLEALNVDYYLKENLSGFPAYPSTALPLLPVCSCYLDNGNGSSDPTDSGTFVYEVKNGKTAYFGYAVKNDKIITFTSTNTTTTSPNTYITDGLIHVGLIGFDAMNLCSQSDSYNIFEALLTVNVNSANETSYTKKNAERINVQVQTLNSGGNLYAEESKQSYLYLSTKSMSGQIEGISSNLNLSSCYITSAEGGETGTIRTTTPYLTSDGYTSKGMVDIDFLACAFTNDSSQLNSCKPYANGNYLLGCKDFGQNMQYYVGWDPSNPDITNESAWTAYTGT